MIPWQGGPPSSRSGQWTYTGVVLSSHNDFISQPLSILPSLRHGWPVPCTFPVAVTYTLCGLAWPGDSRQTVARVQALLHHHFQSNTCYAAFDGPNEVMAMGNYMIPGTLLAILPGQRPHCAPAVDSLPPKLSTHLCRPVIV